MPAEARYVVLHIGCGPSRTEEKQCPSPLIVRGENSSFDLNNDIWIERLDEQLAKNIRRACEPPHYRIDSYDDGRHLYAFVSRVPPHEQRSFEGLSDLGGVIALSRLVHPTSTGDRYCAHVMRFGDTDSPIFAVRYRGVSPDVSLAPNSGVDWLSVADGEVLRKLMRWVDSTTKMHDRVHHAYWNHEHAMRSYYLDVRWTLVVSGLEALVNTKKEEGGRRQFRERVAHLSREFNVSLSDDELNDAYTLRSELVHAQKFLVDLATVLPIDDHIPLYHKLESLLRMTVLRSLLDDNFGGYFRDAGAVDARWPLVPQTGKKSKRKKRP